MSFLWPARGGPVIDYISEPPDRAYCEKIPRSLCILGSTGSIGGNALDIVDQAKGFFKVTALACGKNVPLLASQAIKYQPPVLCALDARYARTLRDLLPRGYQPEILYGPAGYAEIASRSDVDCVLCAQSGSAGFAGALAAALAGKVIALANKESLVLGGELLRRVCARTGAAILPVDSEHFAIFQCLSGHGQEVAKLALTASGGPFLNKKFADLKNCRAKEALKHPNWNMGAKISIDSATLMNKGLEFIEAMRLYGVSGDNIEILVHPQSIVHSMVAFADNSILAQMAIPDMRLPIGDCLRWPNAGQSFIRPLDLVKIGSLTFLSPDYETFPCLKLAKKASFHKSGPAWVEAGINPACALLNAANETAVELFLLDKCSFYDIPSLIEGALNDLLQSEMLETPATGRMLFNASAADIAEEIEKLNVLAREKVFALAAARDA